MKIDSRFQPPASEIVNEQKQMREVAKGFESVFVNQMITAMRQTITKGGLIPESNAERVYQSMLDTEYSKKISESEMLGLSEIIYQHLLRGPQPE